VFRGKKKKPSPGRAKPPEAAAESRWQVAAARTAFIAALVAGAGLAVAAGMKALERRVLQGPTGGRLRAVRVIFTHRPAWMPAKLERRIAEAIVPPPERLEAVSLTRDIYAAAVGNPWIAQVDHVLRRRSAESAVPVVEVSCRFRKPLARIMLGTEPAYVDPEGVRLPAEDVPKWAILTEADRPGGDRSVSPARGVLPFIAESDVPPGYRPLEIHYINILGVQADPPPIGQRWKGDDLAAGLRLIQLLAGRPYANQISAVDVRNHGGRISRSEPFLRMYAQIGQGKPTDIRFGRFPEGKGDYVVCPERKLSYLDAYYEDHNGRLAGLNRYLDLRYDQLHVSLN